MSEIGKEKTSEQVNVKGSKKIDEVTKRSKHFEELFESNQMIAINPQEDEFLTMLGINTNDFFVGFVKDIILSGIDKIKGNILKSEIYSDEKKKELIEYINSELGEVK
jgi:hypothetical protein